MQIVCTFPLKMCSNMRSKNVAAKNPFSTTLHPMSTSTIQNLHESSSHMRGVDLSKRLPLLPFSARPTQCSERYILKIIYFNIEHLKIIYTKQITHLHLRRVHIAHWLK